RAAGEERGGRDAQGASRAGTEPQSNVHEWLRAGRALDRGPAPARSSAGAGLGGVTLAVTRARHRAGRPRRIARAATGMRTTAGRQNGMPPRALSRPRPRAMFPSPGRESIDPSTGGVLPDGTPVAGARHSHILQKEKGACHDTALL